MQATLSIAIGRFLKSHHHGGKPGLRYRIDVA
jgi:hypothetical protein